MTSIPRVMLLIDADNVSTDVIEQAVSRLHAEYGALHVRRAYGTAENAVKHQRLFKRLSIRPMVNLAAGKNSTDIALAVDALDLVLSERPDVVVIASSDSDFAPLVARIREKGCQVRGVGQKGKVGEETPLIYDDFIEFEHRKPRARSAASDDVSAPAPAPASRSRRTRAGEATASADKPAATRSTARKRATARKAAEAAPETSAPESAEAPAKPARKTAARKTTARASAKSAAGGAAEASVETPAPPARKTARKTTARKTAAAKAAPALPAPPLPEKVARAFEVLPLLAAGQRMDVQGAAAVLRKERVFSNADSWPKFFHRYKDWFELLPPERPTHVQRRAPA